MTNSFKKLFLIVSLLLVSIVMSLTACDYFFKEPSFEEVMKEPTARLNKQKMSMIDQETRFDSGVVLPNKRFRYDYTLINQDKFSLNVEGLKKDIYPILLERIKTDTNFQVLKQYQATILYRYRDKKRTLLFDILFSPKQYLERKSTGQ